MKNPKPGVLPWRQAVVLLVALPLAIALAVLAYAWPAARVAPRHLPVGVVAAGAAGQGAVAALEHGKPGAFDVHRYPDERAARSAITGRDVYGAFVVAPGGLTVLEATAASPAVAQLLDTSGRQLAAHGGGGTSGAAAAAVRTVDVVPISADDARGTVFSSALLPLTICGIATALLLTGLLLPGRRRAAGLLAASAVTGLGVLLVAQGFLGALPHDHPATWAALALTTLAVAAPAAGLATLVGPAGIGLAAVLMVFVGNPSSGSTSAPELLPTALGDLGRWLPPGAGANLLRSTAYFDGAGAAGPLAVLAGWSVLGLAAVAFGGGRRGAGAHGAHAAHGAASGASGASAGSAGPDVSGGSGGLAASAGFGASAAPTASGGSAAPPAPTGSDPQVSRAGRRSAAW